MAGFQALFATVIDPLLLPLFGSFQRPFDIARFAAVFRPKQRGGQPDQDAALLEVAREIRKVVMELRGHDADAPLPSTPGVRSDPATQKRNYLALMVNEWRTLRFAALDPTAADPHRGRPMTLEQVYVSLDTTIPRPEQLRRSKKSERDRVDRERESPLSAVEALWQARFRQGV